MTMLLSHQVETSWKKLPPKAGRALRSTADQFLDIAKSIANNTPLDRNTVNASCNPLVDCARDHQHKHVLIGLRNHHNFTYPHGLAGFQINELGRMSAIADVYAGLTVERPYKRAFDPDTAFSIMKQMGGALDQHLLRLFREAIHD